MTAIAKPNLKELIVDSLRRSEQEFDITLPQRLLLAFRKREHERYTDPDTGEPFATFCKWLLAPPPPGCGLAGRRYLKLPTILQHLREIRSGESDPKARDVMGELIEDLAQGQAEKKGKGGGNGSNQHKKVESNRGGTAPVAQGGRHGETNKVKTLQARMADPTAPATVRREWNGYLEGRHKTVTAAAVAAGLVKDSNNPLKRLKENWKKASAKDRKAFLEFLRGEGVGV